MATVGEFTVLPVLLFQSCFSAVVNCVLCILEAAIPVLCRSEMSSLIPEVLQTSSISSHTAHTHTHTHFFLFGRFIMNSFRCISGSASVWAFQRIVVFTVENRFHRITNHRRSVEATQPAARRSSGVHLVSVFNCFNAKLETL